jgi:hypothetical protein
LNSGRLRSKKYPNLREQMSCVLFNEGSEVSIAKY